MSGDPIRKGGGWLLWALFWFVAIVLCWPLALVVGLIIFAVKYARSQFR